MLIQLYRGKRAYGPPPISRQNIALIVLLETAKSAGASGKVTITRNGPLMRSSKSRSRGSKNRNNNRPSGGNIINRVFDSSGPDGKVRGTPQQIIDKYNQLHRDASLSGDRVNAENYAQHAEHYTRLLAEATREVDQKREEQERQNRERQAERDRERAERLKAQEQASGDQGGGDQSGGSEQPDNRGESGGGGQDQPRKESRRGSSSDRSEDAPQDSGLVETPEAKSEAPPAPKPRRPRTRKPKAAPEGEGSSEQGPGQGKDDGGQSASSEAAE
ncbi:hypothetical protein ROA7023_00381 [Roseisalinus antarcticus]|uniref:DUF4167 domain-containing protein n=2 Tax=Roseisalinus antarcticus TaxID=254357 RepID=A0A1Y5RIC3_9RHOB|nr:hypothetical protein ROA7023_00381 [Roseisalinus antarcticus]